MFRRVVRVALALTLVAVGSLFFGVPADARPSDRSGRLAFMRQDLVGHWQVWVGSTNLTVTRQITHENADSGWPVWSPNGQKIAFDTTQADPNPDDETVINDVFMMNADGSSVTNLTGSLDGAAGNPGWSPDGSLIAFEVYGGPEKHGIYVMRPDGSHIRRITAVPPGFDSDSAARFSPDGHRLVFTRFGLGDQGSALFTTDLRGNTTQITSFAIHAGDAVWSPRGRKIVFEAYPAPTSFGDVYVVNANGKHLRNVTQNAPGDGSADPVWSPDGRKILFLQGRRLQQDSRVLGLAIMRSDGSNRHFIEEHPIESHQPDWVRPTTSR